MRSPGVGAQISGDRVTNTTTTGFTGGPWTFTRTAVASSAETIMTLKVGDDSASYFEFRSATASDARFDPLFRGVGGTSQVAMRIQALGTQDSGSNAGIKFSVGTVGGAAFTTRPLCEWDDNGSIVLQMLPLNSGANSCLSWGTQAASAPAFTTRANGNRLVLYSAITGSTVDIAIGAGSSAVGWCSIPAANSNYIWRFYGGTTSILEIRGDGLLTTTGGRVKKLRVATTTPVTVAVTDEIVVTNLAAPGAVAVSLPATPTTGTEFTIKDGKGDAAANNITITPAAGNIDGAGTLVLAANYAVARLIYNGTQWNRIGS